MIKFQLCSESDNPILNPKYIANIKHDGRRVIVSKEGNNITLFGRDSINPENYLEIVTAFQNINSNFVVDCEFVVFTDDIKTDRGLLQSKDKTKDKFKIGLLRNLYPATAVIFDILEFNGQDLKDEEYYKRKRQLLSIFTNFSFDIQKSKDPIKVAMDLEPKAAWELAQNHQLEGIVEKDKNSKYSGLRNNDWIKIKRKFLVTIKFTGYEVQNAGITLTSPEGHRVACNGEKHIKVKELIDKQGFANCRARAMQKTESGRYREIVFYDLEE